MMCLQACKPWLSRPRQYQTGVEQPRHIPLLQNRNFTGRDKELKELQCTLNAEKYAALTALTGLGGVGETQLGLPANRSPGQS